MSSIKSSRHRKQRFPRLDNRRILQNQMCIRRPRIRNITPSDDEDASSSTSSSRHSRSTPLPKPSPLPRSLSSQDDVVPPSRTDRRARDEHNEQERSRRRELAVIYELIRSSFSDHDLRYVNQYNGPRTLDKLSYPQVLHVAYHLLKEEQHDLTLFEKMLGNLKRIEREFVGAGLPVMPRPKFPSISENYRKVINVVDNLLKSDKISRSMDGVYELTPTERAAYGNYQLCMLDLQRSSEPDNPSTSSSSASGHSDFHTGQLSHPTGRFQHSHPAARLSQPQSSPRLSSTGAHVYLRNRQKRKLKRSVSSISYLYTQNQSSNPIHNRLHPHAVPMTSINTRLPEEQELDGCLPLFNLPPPFDATLEAGASHFLQHHDFEHNSTITDTNSGLLTLL